MPGGIRRTWPIMAAAVAMVALLVASGGGQTATVAAQHTASAPDEIPTFQYDPTWPRPLPNLWNTGNIGGISIDSKDHIWIVQRPASTGQWGENYGLTGEGECCFPAPPIMEFDQAGNLLQAWGPIHDKRGGLISKQVWSPIPSGGNRLDPGDPEWPLSEHGIFVDDASVYVGGNSTPSQILKFNRNGGYVRRFGEQEAKSSNDRQNFAKPTQMFVDPKANELYVADGYGNRRIVVLDAETGAYKRHWGAYGRKPADGPQGDQPVEGEYDPARPRSQSFAKVHCVVPSKDGLVYVCDAGNHRIQVFKTDGTFVLEGLVGEKARGFGSVHGIGISPDQRFLYVADGANKKIWILRRADLKVIGSFSSGGRMGGQVLVAHAVAVDSKGNVYVGESIDNDRVQRFNFTGVRRAPQ